MLFAFEALRDDEVRAIARIDRLREDLHFHVVQTPRRWSGLLARMTRAKAIRGSNSIEGIYVSQEDAIAAIDGADPSEADRRTWQAVTGYRQAMDYILQRCRNRDFAFSPETLLAVHFMIAQSHLDANPGNWRPGWVCVRDARSGDIVHEGVDRDRLEPLIDELVTVLNGPPAQPVLVKAAMAHLNLAMLHPFSDGNGRAARCLQTAVLAKEGIVAPVFSSIEEYIGAHQQAYYDVLADVGGGGWHPDRDTRPWVRFCLAAHYHQARTLLRRTRELERVYAELQALTDRLGLHERTTLALVEAAFGFRVRNASYRVAAEVSVNLASRDLKALVDHGLLVASGERRGRHYAPADRVLQIRDRHRLPKNRGDPFAPGDE